MPYNSYFPAGYQPMQYYPQYQVQNAPTAQPTQQASQAVQPTSGIIWVQGEAGAKSYLVAPNTTVQLWDSENQTIYLKSADASGMPSIKTLDYTIREAVPQTAPLMPSTFDSTAFATKAELESLSAAVAALRGDFEGLTKRSAGRPKKEAADGE